MTVYRVQGLLPHSQFRDIVHANMPFDTGNMFLRGTTFTQSQNEQRSIYDAALVPYIIYQEKGFRHYITKNMVEVNKGFISDLTVSEIARASVYQQMGVTSEASSYRDAVQARSSMLANGLYTEIKQHSGDRGVRTNDTIGIR